MTDAPTCETCGGKLYSGPGALVCLNPRCKASGGITDTAAARIIIEARPGEGFVVTFWRGDGLSPFRVAPIASAMLQTAQEIVPGLVRGIAVQAAQRN
jgi:hypothetical protein